MDAEKKLLTRLYQKSRRGEGCSILLRPTHPSYLLSSTRAPLGFPLNSLLLITQLYDFIDGSQIHITINSQRPYLWTLLHRGPCLYSVYEPLNDNSNPCSNRMGGIKKKRLLLHRMFKMDSMRKDTWVVLRPSTNHSVGGQWLPVGLWLGRGLWRPSVAKNMF